MVEHLIIANILIATIAVFAFWIGRTAEGKLEREISRREQAERMANANYEAMQEESRKRSNAEELVDEMILQNGKVGDNGTRELSVTRTLDDERVETVRHIRTQDK